MREAADKDCKQGMNPAQFELLLGNFVGKRNPLLLHIKQRCLAGLLALLVSMSHFDQRRQDYQVNNGHCMVGSDGHRSQPIANINRHTN